MSYASVLVFGRVRIVEEATAKQEFFDAPMVNYRTAEETRPRSFYPRIDHITLYSLEVERLTGKEVVLPDIFQPTAHPRPHQNTKRPATKLLIPQFERAAAPSGRRVHARACNDRRRAREIREYVAGVRTGRLVSGWRETRELVDLGNQSCRRTEPAASRTPPREVPSRG